LLRMTDIMTSQNIDLSSWDTLYTYSGAFIDMESYASNFKIVLGKNSANMQWLKRIERKTKMIKQQGWYSDSLQAGRYRDRILVEARSFVLVRYGSESHSASRTIGTGSCLGGGVKRAERDAEHPSTSSPEVSNRLVLYHPLPSVSAKTCHGVNFNLWGKKSEIQRKIIFP
jgi:hypothetical protein